ncbi:MAG: LysR substrate-binding domain-containing protein [Pigmentiphaga sp.]|uniref:LysR substrate-binding domain-containing protein n=1 Tax=Pigmentiphaga sp. TaxID=1977564 RepID=UPI003B56D473
MELRHLRYFVALASSLSFTRAAERVHVAQSTLSHQIKQLEQEVGRPLFDRIGKRIALTEAGETFLGHAMRAIQEIDQGLGTLKAFGEELSGSVRIGATQTFNLGFIPECVAAFMALHPTVQMLVNELSADAIDSRLRNDELDLGIAYRPVGPSELHFEALFDEEMVLVVSKSHPLAQRKRVRMVELNRQRMVLLPREFSTRGMIDDCFRTCGAEPVIVAEMNAVASMLATVARTDVAAIVAQNAVPASDDLRAIALESPTPVRTPGILWKRATQHPQQVRAFAGIIRKLAYGGRMRARHGFGVAAGGASMDSDKGRG